MKFSKHMMVTAVLSLMLAGPALAQGGSPDFAALHDALRLRPDQEPAWQMFERANARDSQDEARHRNAYQQMESLQAPQRMDLSIQLLRSDLEQLEQRAAAMKAFYTALSPDQRETFDRETSPARR